MSRSPTQSRSLDRMTLDQLVGHVERLRIAWENTRGADAIAAAWRTYETAKAVLDRRMEFARTSTTNRGRSLAHLNRIRSLSAAVRAPMREMHSTFMAGYTAMRVAIDEAIVGAEVGTLTREQINRLLAPMAQALRTCALDIHAALSALHDAHTQHMQPAALEADSTTDPSPSLPPPPDPYNEED